MGNGWGSNGLSNSGPRNKFLAHTVAVAAFSYLTSGVYLSGLAISVGAGDVLVGYLSIILNICGVITLAFSSLLERFRSRKRLALCLTGLSRAATILIVVVPAWAPRDLRLPLLMVTVVLAFTLQSQTTAIINQWTLCFVNPEKGGRYISLRQTLNMGVTVAFSLAGGWYMDFVEGRYEGFVAVFAVAAVFGTVEVLLLGKIPDSMVEREEAKYGTLRELLGVPLKDNGFRRFVINVFAFYLLLTLADSFTIVYMMKYLALPYQTVTALQLIMALPQVVLLGLWGRVSDRLGHATALKASVALFAGEMLLLCFTSPKTWFVCIPVGFFIAAVANAGFSVAVFNRRYELMPKEHRITYDNVYAAAVGCGSMLGPMLGGWLKDALGRTPALWHGMVFGDIRLLYLVSAVGIILMQVVFGREKRLRGNMERRENEGDT